MLSNLHADRLNTTQFICSHTFVPIGWMLGPSKYDVQKPFSILVQAKTIQIKPVKGDVLHFALCTALQMPLFTR